MTTARPSRLQLLFNWMIFLVSVAVLGVALLAYYKAATKPPGGKKGKGRGFKFTVKTAPVVRGDLTPSLVLLGDVVSRKTTTIRAEVSGVVREAPVREGQQVKAGAALFTLESRDLLIALRRQQAQSLQASAARKGARAVASKARDLVTRLSKLDRHKIVSEEEVTRARIDLRSAEAGVAQARAQGALAYTQILAARRDLARARIVAPYAGRLSRRFVEVGDRVSVGGAVAELVGGQGLEMHLYLPVSQVARVAPGAALRFRLAGAQGAWRAGSVDRLLPVADSGSRNQTAVVVLNEPPAGFAAGLAIEARLGVGKVSDALLLTMDALTRFGDNWVVYKIVKGRAERVVVSILGEDGPRVAVRGALEPGEAVVVVGNEALFPGAPVRVVGPPGPMRRVVGSR